MSVLMIDGAMAFTRTFLSPHSTDRLRASAESAALVMP